MKNIKIIVLIAMAFMGCRNENTKMQFLAEVIPEEVPIVFQGDLVSNDQLIHRGVFSPEFDEYYYTVSDKEFKKFDVYMISKTKGEWSKPEKAFFNTNYNEHGMSLTADGNSLYFSSTRPVNINGVAPTWHIWRSKKVKGKWTTPAFVDIPNLKDKLVSHPTITNRGTLYFHASNLDYSEMDIYYSKQVNGKFEKAQRVSFFPEVKTEKCTPYISPRGHYLIFAAIEDQLDLMISFSDGAGGWEGTRKLSDQINTNGQGNPYVTPDDQFLFFAAGEYQTMNWQINWVNIESELLRD